MSNLLRTGASWLNGVRVASASDTVTYRRGGRTVDVAATKGPPLTEIDTQYGILKIISTPWIVSASLLVIGGVTITPQKNDVIEESNGARWLVLQDNGEQEAQPSDPYGYAWRIQTKRIEEPS